MVSFEFSYRINKLTNYNKKLINVYQYLWPISSYLKVMVRVTLNPRNHSKFNKKTQIKSNSGLRSFILCHCNPLFGVIYLAVIFPAWQNNCIFDSFALFHFMTCARFAPTIPHKCQPSIQRVPLINFYGLGNFLIQSPEPYITIYHQDYPLKRNTLDEFSCRRSLLWE